MIFHSQLGQDRILDAGIFNRMRGGVFVDVGAHDGLHLSNTLFFERERGWTGLCVEANPSIYSALKQNRRAICVGQAISDHDGTAHFIRVDSDQLKSTMYSGLVETMHPEHLAFIDQRLRERGGKRQVVEVPIVRLAELLASHGIAEVHYLSMDIEGGEVPALRSIDFKKTFIHVATVECNRGDASELVAATEGNLVLAAQLKHDVFLVNPRSPFNARRSHLQRAIRFTLWRQAMLRWLRSLR